MRDCEVEAASQAKAGEICGLHSRADGPRAALATWGLAAFLAFGIFAGAARLAAAATPSEPAKSVALLNVQFLNDHKDLEPTTAAERARVALIESVFEAKREASGRYRFVVIPPEAAAKMAAGPEVGACGGCEFGYGKEIAADNVAWIVVQKVSDLNPQHQRLHGRRRGPQTDVRP